MRAYRRGCMCINVRMCMRFAVPVCLCARHPSPSLTHHHRTQGLSSRSLATDAARSVVIFLCVCITKSAEYGDNFGHTYLHSRPSCLRTHPLGGQIRVRLRAQFQADFIPGGLKHPLGACSCCISPWVFAFAECTPWVLAHLESTPWVCDSWVCPRPLRCGKSSSATD